MVHFKRKKNFFRLLSPAQILSASFLVLILLGALVLWLPLCAAAGTQVNFLQALFTSTSAVCVTGLTVLATGSDFSLFGQIVILVLFQLGGLGIMLFSTALFDLMGRRLGLRERVLVQQSNPGLSLSGASGLAKRIVLFSLLCEGIGFFGLWLAWAGELGVRAPYHALFHSVSAFCNAGFSLRPDSLTGEVANPLVNAVVITLIVLGGLGFFVCQDVVEWHKKSNHRLSLHTYVCLTTTVALIVGGSILFYLFEFSNPLTLKELSGPGQFWASLLQSVCRTAGFNSIPIGDLREETTMLMIGLMFIGGCSGSTAGGIKVTTFALLLLAAWSQMLGRREVVIYERRVEVERILQALSLFVIACFAVMSCTLVLNYLEPGEFRDVLFETVSAVATVGLSTGITPSLSTPSMLLLCVVMFLGRVGPLTVAASLLQNGTRYNEIRYAKGDITIG